MSKTIMKEQYSLDLRSIADIILMLFMRLYFSKTLQLTG